MDDAHYKLLNASGFAFQLAVEATVRAAPGRIEWRVVGREHPWQSGGSSGFTDIILTCGNLFVVVECKRTRDAAWMFLMPEGRQSSRSHAKVAWIDTKPHRPALAGWGDIQVYPNSPESDFCAIRGQGENDRPMLERIAGQVVSAAEGLCADLVALHERSARSKVVIPAIVTNADLVVAKFDPSNMDLSMAEVVGAEFTTVPHVRFRKALGATHHELDYEPEELSDLSESAVRTVFVVHASAFTEWLDALDISPRDGRTMGERTQSRRCNEWLDCLALRTRDANAVQASRVNVLPLATRDDATQREDQWPSQTGRHMLCAPPEPDGGKRPGG